MRGLMGTYVPAHLRLRDCRGVWVVNWMGAWVVSWMGVWVVNWMGVWVVVNKDASDMKR